MGDNVLSRVKTLEAQGDLQFPANYSPENAMKSAMLQLQELKDLKKMVINQRWNLQLQPA